MPADARPRRWVVTGVAGSGKSTVGAEIARRVGARYLDADDVHPEANVAKMAAGIPLTDADRWPWLARLRAELRRRDGDVVVTCSALARRYRDLLRQAGGVRFVFLDIDPATARDRIGGRGDHFMGVSMVDGQFSALERPAGDEPDVAVVDATADLESVVSAAIDRLADPAEPGGVAPLIGNGSPAHDLDGDPLEAHIDALAEWIVERGVRRVLLVPPDHTRLHARAGPITAGLTTRLDTAGLEVGILPATGTHVAMTPADSALAFGPAVAHERLLGHDWRHGLVELGEIAAAEVATVSHGRLAEAIPVAIDAQLLAGWDLVVSIGQVVPHEVIGMANFTKNLVIGLGGAQTIHRSHFLGAVCGMESIMGRASTPVRDVIDAAFDRLVAPRVEVLWILTVVEAAAGATLLRGLYAGTGGTSDSGGAAFRAAADLAERVNVVRCPQRLDRVACWLDPDEFRSTWLANKAVYRTRMAVADGGELLVLAPGVERFGEDPAIDALVRRHGYRGTAATMAAIAVDPDLAASPATAAHLIHGSSEGRFRIVYCTDPGRGGLERHEIEAVGYQWRHLDDAMDALGVGAATATGPRVDRAGNSFHFIAAPALGLWTAAADAAPGSNGR